MNKEKQIEEMAKIMLEASTSANVEPVLEMESKEVVLGENATKILNNILEQAFIPFLAEKLTDKGYRKASEVALEVISTALSKIQIMISAIKAQEERGTVTEFNGGAKTALEIVSKDLAELKKKYTEGSK